MIDVPRILLFTLQIAGTAILIIGVPAVLVAYLLARRRFWGKTLVETLVALPLVLPPTAVGYLLLRAFAYGGPLGPDTLGFDLGLLLSWRGAVLASSVMAWPLVVRTARVAFEGVDPRLESMARTLGLGRVEVFARITLPLASRGLLAAFILGFTRALGEFGATIIVAGNLPETYESVEFLRMHLRRRRFDLIAGASRKFLEQFLGSWLA